MLNSNLNKNFNRGPNYIYLNDNYTYNHQEINEQNIRNQTRQNEVDFIPKKINSGLLLNPIQSPSQSSLIFQQKPSLTDLNLLNKNNNNVSGIFYDEGDELKIILKNSNDNNYFRSSLSFETQKYPYELFLGNYTNSNMNINNSTKNISHNKISYNNMNTNLKQNNNNAPFKPLNIYYNKNFIKNIVNPNIIYNNNNNINYENIYNMILNIIKNIDELKVDNENFIEGLNILNKEKKEYEIFCKNLMNDLQCKNFFELKEYIKELIIRDKYNKKQVDILKNILK